MIHSEKAGSLAHIVKTLEEEIIFGRLRPRERLIEDTLLQRFDAKRYVVRQALAELERMGIVVKERNKGAMIRDFTAEEVEHIYEMRELLHVRAVERMPLPGSTGLVATLRDINARQAAANESGEMRDVFNLNDAFHETMFAACGNPYLAESILQYQKLSHAIRSWRIGESVKMQEARIEHDAMIDAIESGDRATLARLVVDHIHPSKDAYLAAHLWSAK